MSHSILLVDDDAGAARQLRGLLSSEGYDVDVAQGVGPGRERLDTRTYDGLLVDPGHDSGQSHALISYALRTARCYAAWVVSGTPTVQAAVGAMRAGAHDFIAKPFDNQTLLQTLRNTFQISTPPPDDLQDWRRLHAPDLIGCDPQLLATLTLVRRIADTDCDVLITGASGTGKELIARSIHMASARRNKPFVAINCAAIPKDLMESEIFGHARGAFTGATERRGGKFEAADGGTLFLDEVGEMDATLQGKFLRVIQEREFSPIGDNRVVKADVRIISATNQNLEQLCRDRIFREDLYYRLNVVPIHMAPLKERRQDIPLLVEWFLARACRRHNRKLFGIDSAAMRYFCEYAWPGNVRELQNLIERMVVLKADDEPVSARDIPLPLMRSGAADFLEHIRLPQNGLDINEALARMETRLTLEALQQAHGNKAKAAELLGLKRTTLVERLKKLSLIGADEV